MRKGMRIVSGEHAGSFSRRSLLQATLAAAVGGICRADEQPADAAVQTVTGRRPAADMGTTLPHEHLLVDFVGADQVSPQRYDADEVFRRVLPYLEQFYQLGGRTLFECTPAYLGRDPQLLVRLSQASGVHLVTNTGYYGAAGGKYLPPHAHQETAEQLAARWLAEWTDGIEGSEVRPGFIKIGMDAGPLAPVNRKLIEAAAQVHLASGLTIAAHTGDGQAALQQLDVLQRAGVAASAWIWVHAQTESNQDLHRQAAARGAWIEFDGVAPGSIEQHVQLVQNLDQAGYLHRILLSHDAGWYSVGEPRGGEFRAFDTLFTALRPAWIKAGYSDRQWQQLTADQPAKAFTSGIRQR